MENSLHQYIKGKFFPNADFGVVVEVGAAGPEHLSQSKPFKDDGWRSICVEPNPKFAQMHRDCGNEIYECAASSTDGDDIDFHISSNCQAESFSSLGISTSLCLGSGYQGRHSIQTSVVKVKVRKLDSILQESGVSEIDCLIIDVEGWELDVLKGFNSEKYKPTVIVLEVVGGEEVEKEYTDYMEEIGYQFDSYDNTTGPNIVYSKVG